MAKPEQGKRADRILPKRLRELIDRYSGCLDTGGALRRHVGGLRREWRDR